MLLAVLFLEFWKRRQFILQHDWDVLGYEKAEVQLRMFLIEKLMHAYVVVYLVIIIILLSMNFSKYIVMSMIL